MNFKVPRITKINLVLDFDETLVHITRIPLKKSKIVPFIINDYSDKYYVYIRPGLKKFLNSVKDNYTLFIWTASTKRFLYLVMDNVGIDRSLFKHIFTRKHCIDMDSYYTKDLTRYFSEYELSQTVLVDNSFYNFIPQPSNGYHIKTFLGNHNDKALRLLQLNLKLLKNREDVRPYLMKIDKIIKKIPIKFIEEWENYCEMIYEIEKAKHEVYSSVIRGS